MTIGVGVRFTGVSGRIVALYAREVGPLGTWVAREFDVGDLGNSLARLNERAAELHERHALSQEVHAQPGSTASQVPDSTETVGGHAARMEDQP